MCSAAEAHQPSVLPVVFPDGSKAALVYPPRLRLAELGLQPAVSAGIKNGNAFRHERFLMITKAPLRHLRREGEPTETYQGPTGKVTIWRAKRLDRVAHGLLVRNVARNAEANFFGR